MNKEIFGGLLQFETNQQLNEFIESIDKEMSIKLIELSIDYIMKNGLFTLEESYCLYKSINKLRENEKIESTNKNVWGKRDNV